MVNSVGIDVIKFAPAAGPQAAQREIVLRKPNQDGFGKPTFLHPLYQRITDAAEWLFLFVRMPAESGAFLPIDGLSLADLSPV